MPTIKCPHCALSLELEGTHSINLSPTGQLLQVAPAVSCPSCSTQFSFTSGRYGDVGQRPITTARAVARSALVSKSPRLSPDPPVHMMMPYRTLQQFAKQYDVAPLNQPKRDLHDAIISAWRLAEGVP